MINPLWSVEKRIAVRFGVIASRMIDESGYFFSALAYRSIARIPLAGRTSAVSNG
jgi:hypothetical protein